jgi:hypothetical protein
MTRPSSISLESDSWEAAVLICACESIPGENFAILGKPFHIGLAGISSALARFLKDDYVSMETIDRICKTLGADTNDLLESTGGNMSSELTALRQTSRSKSLRSL